MTRNSRIFFGIAALALVCLGAIGAQEVTPWTDHSKDWWPGMMERNEVLARVDGLREAVDRLGWDDLELDKFLARCALEETEDTALLEYYPHMDTGLFRQVRAQVWLQVAGSRLRHALQIYILEFSNHAGVVEFWKSTDMVEKNLLLALEREYAAKPEEQRLNFDPFTGSQDRDGEPFVETTYADEMDGSRELAIGFRKKDDGSLLVFYQFVKINRRWMLVDIRYPPISLISSLREQLGLPNIFNSLGMELIVLPGSEAGTSPVEWPRMSATEISREQFLAIIQESSEFPATRELAEAFCDGLGYRETVLGRLPRKWHYRLPTEKEWKEGKKASGFRVILAPREKASDDVTSLDVTDGFFRLPGCHGACEGKRI